MNWQVLPNEPWGYQLRYGLTIIVPSAIAGLLSNVVTILSLGLVLTDWDLKLLGWLLTREGKRLAAKK